MSTYEQQQQLKADMFDYVCWLETVSAPEELSGGRFIVFASDGVPVDGETYADAIRVAMEHDKEIYDSTKGIPAARPQGTQKRGGGR